MYPDQRKRASATDKTKAGLAAIESDFSKELVTLAITHDPVDTIGEIPSAQAVNQQSDIVDNSLLHQIVKETWPKW